MANFLGWLYCCSTTPPSPADYYIQGPPLPLQLPLPSVHLGHSPTQTISLYRMAVPPPLLSHVSIHGATLASMLQSAVVGGDCDGLLFGQLRTKRTKHLQDNDSETIMLEESEACVTAYVCSTASCSFYDAAGNVQADRLQELQPGELDPLIGWFSFRPNTPLVASMREAAVSQCLRQTLDSHSQASSTQNHPLLFMMLSCGTDHSSATLSLQYKMLQNSSSNGVQYPVEMRIINLAQGLGQKSYEDFHPVLPLMDLNIEKLKYPNTSSPSKSQDESAQKLVSPHLTACVESATNQVKVVEEYYNGVLQHFGALCRRVTDHSSAVVSLAEENRRMEMELEALERKGAGMS